MMRYVFDKSDLDEVRLSEEIQYIEGYMYMQKLRFEEAVRVETVFSDTCTDKYIAPMLLIPFVENAFKYGVNSSEESMISCRITCGSKGMDMSITNRILADTETMPSTGVGLANVRKRLALIYPGKHELLISQDDGTYTVQLKIQL